MKSIYLVMDMINDLVHEDSPIAQKRYRDQIEKRGVLENTALAIEKARGAGLPIGYVRIGFSPDYRECPPNSGVFSAAPKSGMFKLGEWGTEVYPSIAPRPGDFDIVKHRVSPFYCTNLEVILRTHGIQKIFMSGISTTGVVHSCIKEGHDRDYDLTVLANCSCAPTDDAHDFVMKSTRNIANITSAQEVDFSA